MGREPIEREERRGLGGGALGGLVVFTAAAKSISCGLLVLVLLEHARPVDLERHKRLARRLLLRKELLAIPRCHVERPVLQYPPSRGCRPVVNLWPVVDLRGGA